MRSHILKTKGKFTLTANISSNSFGDQIITFYAWYRDRGLVRDTVTSQEGSWESESKENLMKLYKNLTVAKAWNSLAKAS